MSYHSLEFKPTECPNCSNHSIPFKKDFKCPYCGHAIDVYYDFVSEVVKAMICHKDMHGSFFPIFWSSVSITEQIEGDIFNFFDELEERKLERTKESINKILDELKYESDEYKQHFKEIVLAINDKYEIESKNSSMKLKDLVKIIKDRWQIFLVIPFVVFIIWISISDLITGQKQGEYQPTSVKEKTINRDTAIEQHWDEIKELVNGTENIDACSEESNHCYSVDADIYNGIINQIYFSKGGNIDIGIEIDSNGKASGFDYEKRAWDFTVDMDSSMIDDAIQEWADNNDYKIE